MADKRLSELTAQTGAAVAAGDLWLSVDVSDTTDNATGTDKSLVTSEMLIAMNSWASVASVSGSDATTTGQSLVDVTGLSVALASGHTYELEAVMLCSVSADTTGTKYGINFSAGGATVNAVVTATTTSQVAQAVTIASLNTSTAACLTGTNSMSGTVVMKGFLTTTTNAGNLTVEHMKITSGTSTVKVGSLLKVRQVA